MGLGGGPFCALVDTQHPSFSAQELPVAGPSLPPLGQLEVSLDVAGAFWGGVGSRVSQLEPLPIAKPLIDKGEFFKLLL